MSYDDDNHLFVNGLIWVFCFQFFRMAVDVKIRKTPTTEARILDNLLEGSTVHIRK
ncbi:hypothetical protein HanXRQr2_Chr04g0154111 [Helianthus annuus]|uniref:Uncharacterized protein n=1 Tax=Helianthus annuus TaxID=4232 RepID=A0A9K3J5K9_HELAN|nr:hypothetical protein HanXRQr2_Chr04g0154111 [Helianthus annuus]KAJ0930358.1 hypothetical protein HanPSC8_Chr04g0148381 [Helianthus annuus]